MIICPKCGTENKDTAKFCKGCGAPLKGVESVVLKPTTTAPAPSSTAAMPRPKISNQRILTVAETGEVLEKVDREADEEGIHILSNTFAETLTQLAKSREELARIEERIADALRIQRGKEEKRLQEISASYELTQQKIRALEELSALRRLSAGEEKLAAIFRGEEVDIGDELFGPGEELEEEENLEESPEEEDILEDELSGESPLDDLDEELEELEPAGEGGGETFTCGNCGAEVPADAKVCPVCGAQFED